MTKLLWVADAHLVCHPDAHSSAWQHHQEAQERQAIGVPHRGQPARRPAPLCTPQQQPRQQQLLTMPRNRSEHGLLWF
jgi:hypothetical protein